MRQILPPVHYTVVLIYSHTNISLLHKFSCTWVEIFSYITITSYAAIWFFHTTQILLHSGRSIFLHHHNSFLCSNRNISQLSKFSCTAAEIFPTTPELLHSNRNISLPHKFSLMYSSIKIFLIQQNSYTSIGIFPYYTFFCTAVEILSYHTSFPQLSATRILEKSCMVILRVTERKSYMILSLGSLRRKVTWFCLR